jgi:hypothetical protein
MALTATHDLTLSGDRKVTPLVRRQTSKDAVLVRNSFGLPGGESCPGKTPFCDGCYAIQTEKVFPSASRLVQRNYAALLAHGDDVDALAAELGAMVAEYAAEFDKYLAKGRVAPEDNIFRIHWDGDFYSLPYAQAWAKVIAMFPQIQFWAYTRSFDFVPALVNIPNLTLYLSVDQYNALHAKVLLDLYPSVREAACATTQAEAQAVSVRKSGVACPENVKRIPLVVASSGKRTEAVTVGDDAQGACSACMLCVNGTRDVRFAVKHK